MDGCGLGFGSAAVAYERYRADYPAEVVDRVLAYAGRPVASALEIGAGTGKATRVFAARGIAVTATDPDALMLEELVRHVPPTVNVVQGTLEDVVVPATYDLVYAAASLHWTASEQRWERVASLLVDGGTFANVGGPVQLADPDVAALVADARRPYLESDDFPSPDGTPLGSDLQWPGTELRSSTLFTDVRQVVMSRRLSVPAADYLGLLSTVSAYLALGPSVRDEVLARILTVLPEQVELDLDLTLHLARLVAGSAPA